MPGFDGTGPAGALSLRERQRKAIPPRRPSAMLAGAVSRGDAAAGHGSGGNPTGSKALSAPKTDLYRRRPIV